MSKSMQKNKMRRKGAGFTLIELMISLVIVGVLLAFALPSYQQYTQRTRRVDAERALMELRQSLERGYSTTYSYETAAANVTIPATVTGYSIQIDEDLSASSYRLSATPVTGGPQADDPCGTLTLNQSGTKTTQHGTLAECW